ncbi:hypothetical protein LUZ60_001383 [Juncus effusus]|nr:hypothetical protein LUZ60_001383 [Juncus effusus]
MENSDSNSKHIILIHGACHGAWCWYKVVPLLHSAGYKVTVPDMAASGRDERKISEVLTFRDYCEPLLEIMRAIPSDEKVMLVGHSLGGLNIALAMEDFSEKISVAVFLTAFMPDCNSPPSNSIDEFSQGSWVSSWADTEFKSYDNDEKRPTTMFFGPDFMQSRLYQLSSQEDLTLGMSLNRKSSLFADDLRCQKPFSKSRYGSVDSVYIVCDKDLGIPAKYQHYMLENNNPVKEVKIVDTDHMAMLSAPLELAQCLIEIATKYA